MNATLKRFSVLLLSLCMLFGLSIISSATTTTQNGTAAATTIKPGFNKDSKGVVRYYKKNSNGNLELIKNACLQISGSNSGINFDGTAFKAGYYYFNDNGDLKTTTTLLKKKCTLYTASNANYYAGNLSVKGTYVFNVGKAATAGAYSSSTKLYTGTFSNLIYYNGSLYSGLVLEKSGSMYNYSAGKRGTSKTGRILSNYLDLSTNTLRAANKNLCYKNGKPFTGISACEFFKAGKKQAYKGWQKLTVNGVSQRYYFKNGKAVTGWNYLKSFSGDGKTYKYYFSKDTNNCALVTNLFALDYNKYIHAKMKLFVNIKIHNITFMAYDNQTKSYCIPLKTVVCSDARDGKGTKTGNFRLEKTCRKRWFIYTKSSPYHYYQWGVHIKGSKSWFHSELYGTTSNKSLKAWAYNGLGTRQTTACIRMQACNAKLIYDIASKTNKKERVYVKIYKSAKKGPFGKITLSDTTGKIANNKKTDPTDPAFTNKKW